MPNLISNDPEGSTGRYTRLMRTLTACQSFCCLSEEPEDQGIRVSRFNRALVQLEDELGVLNVLWETEKDMAEFSDLVRLAWTFQLEDGRVRNAVVPDF